MTCTHAATVLPPDHPEAVVAAAEARATFEAMGAAGLLIRLEAAALAPAPGPRAAAVGPVRRGEAAPIRE